MSKTQPTFFLSHGGGPWPWLRKEMPFLDGLHQSLKDVVMSLAEKPRAIVIVSGHWEEDEFTIMSNPQPPMIYDYYGFPEHTYKIKYAAPGSPKLALRIKAVLGENSISTSLNPERGFDHGVYSLLYPMYPDADIPVVQVSMKNDFNPTEHFRLGMALSSLRREGVLIIGSGNLFHNLREMQRSRIQSELFDSWIRKVVLSQDLKFRNEEILNWESAPFARYCHPREDHLVPLFVALGAAHQDFGTLIFGEPLMGRVSVSSFRFGEI